MTDQHDRFAAERIDLIESLARHRGFLLHTTQGMSDEQLRQRSTVSELTLAGLLKHVADTEEQWRNFAVKGAEAFGGGGVYESDVDWDAVAAQGESADGADGDGDWGEWTDDRFTVPDDASGDSLRDQITHQGDLTADMLRTADLDVRHPLPEAPWFEQGVSWSVRQVALHLLAEISQHAGHADIIREAIDGQKTM